MLETVSARVGLLEPRLCLCARGLATSEQVVARCTLGSLVCVCAREPCGGRAAGGFLRAVLRLNTCWRGGRSFIPTGGDGAAVLTLLLPARFLLPTLATSSKQTPSTRPRTRAASFACFFLSVKRFPPSETNCPSPKGSGMSSLWGFPAHGLRVECCLLGGAQVC